MLPDVVQHDGCRGCCELEPLAAEGVERANAEVVQDAAPRGVGREARPVQPGHMAVRGLGWKARGIGLSQEELRGSEPGYLLRDRAGGQLGYGELAGGDVHQRDAGLGAALRNRGEVVVRAGVQHPRFDHSAGGDDADDAPAHERPAVRFARLLRDGDAVALAHELGQVAVQRVVRDARERHDLALSHVALGKDDLQVARGQPGVLVERLVEVAHAVQE